MVKNAAAQLRLVKKNLSYTDIYSPINGVVPNRNVSRGQTILGIRQDINSGSGTAYGMP